MSVALEIRYANNRADRCDLGRQNYILGSVDSKSALGERIHLISLRVKPDHAVLEFTHRGWFLLARQSQVRIGEVSLEVGEKRPVRPGDSFRIGDVDLYLTEGARQETRIEIDRANPSIAFDALTDKLQSNATVDTERLAKEQRLEPDEDEYRTKLVPIIAKHLRAALNEANSDILDIYAEEALRRELILRLLGHPGLFARPLMGDVPANLRASLDRICRQISEKIGATGTRSNRVKDLERVHAGHSAAYRELALGFNSDTVRRFLEEALVFSVVASMAGTGPVEAMMEIEDISEVMVVGHERIFVELDGMLVFSGLAFRDEQQAVVVADKIAKRSNATLNQQFPYQDARLTDGSRVNLVINPVALSGPTITIRKFRPVAPDLLFLRRKDSLSAAMASFLLGCVVSKKNILVSGGTGTGKTTMVNFLCSMIPKNERIVTIEDTAELKVSDKHGGRLPHVVTLQGVSRTGSAEGHSIRDLVRNALRMRPDRIIVGECRGGEAFDMLQAMNTGHDGSMTTLHANDPEDTMARLENLVMSANEGLPLEAIRFQVASAIDYVVQLKRYADGKKKISSIAEVGRVDSLTGRIEVNPIFEAHYNPNMPESRARFAFAGRTPLAIRDIIEGGFDARKLRF